MALHQHKFIGSNEVNVILTQRMEQIYRFTNGIEIECHSRKIISSLVDKYCFTIRSVCVALAAVPNPSATGPRTYDSRSRPPLTDRHTATQPHTHTRKCRISSSRAHFISLIQNMCSVLALAIVHGLKPK